MNERFAYLESCVAFQDKTIDDLSSVIHRQQQEIDKLNKLCRGLNKRLNELEENMPEEGGPSVEVPPHY
jgi:SlyX protein